VAKTQFTIRGSIDDQAALSGMKSIPLVIAGVYKGALLKSGSDDRDGIGRAQKHPISKPFHFKGIACVAHRAMPSEYTVTPITDDYGDACIKYYLAILFEHNRSSSAAIQISSPADGTVVAPGDHYPCCCSSEPPLR